MSDDPNSPRAIEARYTNWRPVTTRNVLQIILEVELERQGEVLRMLGAPLPASDIRVAIAIIDGGGGVKSAPPGEKPKKQRRFNEMPPSQQCALRCGEPDFMHFINEKIGLPCRNTSETADAVRRYFEIQSRSELDGEQLGKEWRELDAEFYAWQRGGVR